MTRCGEVNRLIGWPFVEASPAICLAHRDLARSQQSPEQHGRDVPPERRKARREMCTKTSAPPLSGAMKPASYSHQHLSDSKLTEPVTSRALPRRSASRRTYPLGARRGKIQGTANGGGGAAQRRFENHRFEGGGAKGHSERRIRRGRRNFVRDGESAHNIWAPIHKSRRISPRRVERIVCQVIGDRAGVMTDALTWAGTFHGIGAGLLCDYTPRNGACRYNVRRTEHGCRGSPRQKIEAALVNKARPLFAGFPEDQGEAYATILSNHPRMSSKVSAT
jgi:hypothetical protein